jgi:hypothetical protein
VAGGAKGCDEIARQAYKLSDNAARAHDTAQRAPGTPIAPTRWHSMPVIKSHLPDAIRNHDIRRTCCAVEAIFRAADMLDELPPECLEQLRDYCNDLNEGRKGMFSEFKHAYIDMVVEHLNDRRLRERRLYTGITGKEWPGLDEHELLARTSITGSGDYGEHDKW